MLTTLASSRYFSTPEIPGRYLALPIVGMERETLTILDMFNYYAEKAGQTWWAYRHEEKCFVVRALQNIERNEIVTTTIHALDFARLRF